VVPVDLEPRGRRQAIGDDQTRDRARVLAEHRGREAVPHLRQRAHCPSPGGARRPAAPPRSGSQAAGWRCPTRPESGPRRTGAAHLQAAEFLYETGLFPDLEYSFKHALSHDVTYSGRLHDRRRELHARIVAAIEALHRDRLGEHIELLAHHALRAELREKAVHYFRQAGLRATARSALRDARACFEQALGVLDALPESPSTLEEAFEIRLELRPALSNLGETRLTLQRLREAEGLAERLSDDHRRGRVCAFLTNVHNELGEPDEARASGARALEISSRLGDLRLHILTTSYLEQAYYLQGEYERVLELASDNLAALPVDWVHEYFVGVATPTSVWDRGWLVMSLAQLGRFAEAATGAAEAIRLAESTHRAYPVAVAYRAAGTLHVLMGDWAKARLRFEHGLAVARMGNAVVLLPYLVASSAWALAQLGEANKALNRFREGEQLLELHAARGPLAVSARPITRWGAPACSSAASTKGGA
jgi:tetratricopeptide (TPR) repeat protein